MGSMFKIIPQNGTHIRDMFCFSSISQETRCKEDSSIILFTSNTGIEEKDFGKHSLPNMCQKFLFYKSIVRRGTVSSNALSPNLSVIFFLLHSNRRVNYDVTGATEHNSRHDLLMSLNILVGRHQ